MSTARQEHPALRGAQLAWAGVMLLALLSVGAGIPSRYAQLASVTPAANTSAGQLRPEDARVMIASGLPVRVYALYFTSAEVLSALAALGVAGLIAWGRSRDWMALFVSLTLTGMATAVPIVPALEAGDPRWAWLSQGWQTVFLGSVVPLFFLFPDGRAVPRWARWLLAGWLIYTLAALGYPPLRLPTSFGRGLTASDAVPIGLMVLGLAAGVAAQIWRYRRVSTSAERQRTKWVVFGFSLMLGGATSGLAVQTYLASAPAGLGHAAARLAGPSLILAGLNALTASIGMAVLRYRLWDVDLVIRRTLTYSALTGVLGLAYLVSVLGLQGVFQVVTGERQNELVTVLSTLAIAALFGPVRGRVQGAIDKRFYRKKYDAARTLAVFGAQARDVVELEQLSERLLGVVEQTMHPAHASLWVKGGEGPLFGYPSKRGR